MALKLPFNDVRLAPGEQPSQQRLEELLNGVQENLDFLSLLYPVQSENLSPGLLMSVGGKKRPLNIGTVELEWNGAGPTSNTKEVTHKLGAVPTWIGLQFASLITVAGSPQLFTFGTEATSSTVFKCNANLPTGTVPGAGAKVTFRWIAIG